MEYWLLIFGMAALTFGPRYLPLALAGKLRIPPLLRKALDFVPIAVLSAIVAKTSFVHGGEIDLALSNHYLYGLIIAGITAWISKQMFPSILAGLAAYAIAFNLL